MKFIKRIRAKVTFYKTLLHEVLETLCSICIVLGRNRYATPRTRELMEGHFRVLKKFSAALREEINEENRKAKETK